MALALGSHGGFERWKGGRPGPKPAHETPYPSSHAQKVVVTTPTAVVMVIDDDARPWPTPKRLAISQALMPVGTDDVSTSAAQGLRPTPFRR